MKDIVLINNKMRGTGIGNYSYNLFAHLKTNTQRNLDFITLNNPSEDSFGSVRAFPQKMMRMVRHSTFISKISHSYKVYHILNPNLGMFLSKCRPSVVTVFDIAALLPKVSREIIAQSYGLDLPEVFAMQMNMRFIKNADRILCMSLNTRRDLTSLLGIDTKRIIVGYPGIDRALFSPRDKKKSRLELGLPLSKQIILHVGVDEPRKNISTLIQAFRCVKKKFPDTVLVRVGGMRESTRKLISSLGLTNSVFHFRKVPNVAIFYNAADMLVFPSYYEGFGYPIAEAMASGCPVVAADSSSIPEVVGTKGILFPPSDVTRLYETVIQVLTDSTMRSKMTEDGFKQCLKFDWETCAQTTLKAYEALNS